MNKSREYIQVLSRAERAVLASAAGTTPEYLYQIGAGFRTPSRRLAAKLEAATSGRVKAVDFDNEIKRAVTA